ncbi:MAG: ATP-binding protein, partial [Candidatus Falkowbacteria bacterium]|nr:ATP-binding protein [Candidatus Falkowbacteria bacterium]
GDLYENYFKENVFAQRGYVILVDDNGDYLYHPNPEIAVRNVHDEYMTKVLAESKELQDLVRNYLAGKTGITKYIYLKEWKLAAYTHAQITPDRFWPITITVPLNEIQGPIESVVLRLQYMSYAVVISLILLSCGIIISLLQWGKTQDIRIRARTQDLENANIAARNVLEDLQAEKEALTMAKAKDEALLASIGEGVVAVDESERIIAVSKATEKMLGWRFDEIKGKNLSDIIPIINEQGEFIPKEKRPMHLALSTSKIITTTTCFYVRKDGTRFPVAIAVAPIILEGKIIGAIDNFRDITKEKEIDKAKTEFVSLASHQLRTPLTSIKWYSDMLLEGDAGDLNPKQKKFVGKLYQGNERMVDLVRNLLNVSRIELGVLAVNPRPIDIGELFKEVIKEQAFAVQEKKHKVVVEIPEGLPKISTDSTLARMIWQNLFSNAIEYTPPKGKITCTAEKKDKEIIIAIKDTGIGIPQKQQNQVFQKLFRGNNAVREHSEGNGLGLYITKAMVEALSGKIWFKSKEGEGTTFYVSLPIKGPKIRSGQKIIGNSLWQN